MNYEDRTDLLSPEQVVAPSLLARLGAAENVAGLIADATQADSRTSPGSAVYEAIRRRVQRDTAPETGAPPEAAALEEDAMLCGYRLAWLILGPQPRPRVPSPTDLTARAESMYLYALPLADAAPVAEITARNVGDATAAHEEATTWAWTFGLGLALVEAGLPAD